jgi:hypothetical protein
MFCLPTQALPQHQACRCAGSRNPPKNHLGDNDMVSNNPIRRGTAEHVNVSTAASFVSIAFCYSRFLPLLVSHSTLALVCAYSVSIRSSFLLPDP